jgi:hypothetical protein
MFASRFTEARSTSSLPCRWLSCAGLATPLQTREFKGKRPPGSIQRTRRRYSSYRFKSLTSTNRQHPANRVTVKAIIVREYKRISTDLYSVKMVAEDSDSCSSTSYFSLPCIDTQKNLKPSLETQSCSVAVRLRPMTNDESTLRGLLQTITIFHKIRCLFPKTVLHHPHLITIRPSAFPRSKSGQNLALERLRLEKLFALPHGLLKIGPRLVNGSQN